MGREKRFRKDAKDSRSLAGTQLIVQDRINDNLKYNLSWFQPRGKQVDICEAIDELDWILIQGKSGVGKTTTVIWKSLGLLGKQGYRKIIFFKNPTEAGDDQIGFLTGDANEKLKAHFNNMREIFLDFMEVGKLESDEKKRNIEFRIPNFELGGTYDNAIVIIDEAQTMSPNTLKMIMERVTDSSKLIVLGDKGQIYSVKKRTDGFTDFVKRVTDVVEDKEGVRRISKEPLLHYIELPSSENNRGDISRRVTEIYSDD